jgi:hypothetical protein
MNATPTRIIVDLATGTTNEVELSGAELEAYNASLDAQRAAQQAAEAAQAVVVAPVETAGIQ